MSKKASQCDQCSHATLKWYVYRGGEPFDVLICDYHHKPRFYRQRHDNPLADSYGWKKVCADFETANARAQGSEHSERPAGATGYAAGGQSDEVRTLRNASNARVDHLQTMLADIWRRRMNDINDWKRYYGEERVKRAELEVATDELVEAAEMVLAAH